MYIARVNPAMSLSLPDIHNLFHLHGHMQYAGEPVTQLEHALQTATLAERDGAGDALIAASLLHDLGHLLQQLSDIDRIYHATPTLSEIDDVHQYRILPFLRALFDDDVLAPIRMHVDAKRYLCAIDPAYLASLSPDSVRSLRLQGGVFDAEQTARFIDMPYAAEAVRLRRWDDLAKQAGQQTRGYTHFVHYLECSARH